MSIPSPVPTQSEQSPRKRASSGVTVRAMLIGLVVTALIDLWIHYAELVLGGTRGHTALANTSIPVGAFSALFALVIINVLLTRIAPRLSLSSPELLTIYVMSAVSTVVSSSGGMHFLIPTITAAHYFSHMHPENGWTGLFMKYVPKWITQSDPEALKAFYAARSEPLLVKDGAMSKPALRSVGPQKGIHLRQKPPDRYHLNSAESHGDGLIGAPGDDGPLRHRQLDHGFGEGTDFALPDAGIGQRGADLDQ